MLRVQEVRTNEQSLRNSLIPVNEWLRWPVWFSKGPASIDELAPYLLEVPEDTGKILVEAFPVHEQTTPPLKTPVSDEKGFQDKGFQVPEENSAPQETFPAADQQSPPTMSTPAHESEPSVLCLDAQEKEEALKKFDKIYGGKVVKIRYKKKSGEARIHTELEGGIKKANKIFEEVTGRELNPVDGVDVEKTTNFEVRFREKGSSGHPKIDINNETNNTYEKITFK